MYMYIHVCTCMTHSQCIENPVIIMMLPLPFLSLLLLSQLISLPRVIVSKMAASEIDFVVQQLVKTRDSRFLQFLSNLCVCNDKPIPSTQSMPSYRIKKICIRLYIEYMYVTKSSFMSSIICETLVIIPSMSVIVSCTCCYIICLCLGYCWMGYFTFLFSLFSSCYIVCHAHVFPCISWCV